MIDLGSKYKGFTTNEIDITNIIKLTNTKHDFVNNTNYPDLSNSITDEKVKELADFYDIEHSKKNKIDILADQLEKWRISKPENLTAQLNKKKSIVYDIEKQNIYMMHDLGSYIYNAEEGKIIYEFLKNLYEVK